MAVAVAIAVVDTHAGGRSQIVVLIDHQLAVGCGDIATASVSVIAAVIMVGVTIVFTGRVAMCLLESATQTAPEVAPEMAPSSGAGVRARVVVPATIVCAVGVSRAPLCGAGHFLCGRNRCCYRSTVAMAEDVVGVFDEVVVAISVVFEVLCTVAVVEVGGLVRMVLTLVGVGGGRAGVYL